MLLRNFAFLLILCSLGFVQGEVHHCCIGSISSTPSYGPTTSSPSPNIIESPCFSPSNAVCYTDTSTSPGLTLYSCGSSTSTGTTCSTDNCNCPATVHKTISGVQQAIGDMRQIMFPVMGLVFGGGWVVLAILGPAIPHDLLLILVALVDAVFGSFLIFLPATSFLGFMYIALGALTIAICRHAAGETGFKLVLTGTILIFLLTGGLTVFSFSTSSTSNSGTYVGGDYISIISNSITTCENDMDLVNWDGTYYNLNLRCENWALFVAFSVFLLFLVQPFAIICAFFLRNGGGGGGGAAGGVPAHPSPE